MKTKKYAVCYLRPQPPPTNRAVSAYLSTAHTQVTRKCSKSLPSLLHQQHQCDHKLLTVLPPAVGLCLRHVKHLVLVRGGSDEKPRRGRANIRGGERSNKDINLLTVHFDLFFVFSSFRISYYTTFFLWRRMMGQE